MGPFDSKVALRCTTRPLHTAGVHASAGKVARSARFPNTQTKPPHPADDMSDARGFGVMLRRFLEALAVAKYAAATIEGRRKQLRELIAWAAERDLTRPQDITRVHLELYQRHLHHYAKADGKPLAVLSQQVKLTAVRVFFRWMAKNRLLLVNPASELELPKTPDRLPKAVLSAAEAERVLGEVDLSAPMGVRDRAILETLYSTGIRRGELIALELTDLDAHKGTLRIRGGKGNKDRVVPIGERAIAWIEKYVSELRGDLLSGTWAQPWEDGPLTDDADDRRIFLLRNGRPLTAAALGQRVAEFVRRADLGKSGSCHLFRHTAATLMLEGGADIRYIQAMLGHAELSTTQIYTRVSIHKLKAIHDATHPGAQMRRRRGAAAEHEQAQLERRGEVEEESGSE